MGSAVRKAVVPVYVLLCLLLGGSAQGIWSNALLQLIGIALIAWAAGSSAGEPLPRPARQLLWLLLAALAWLVLQQLPLPAALWPHLGGRARIAEGYAVLGQPVPPMSISLAPYSSLATLLSAIPAVAILCAMIRLRAFRQRWLVLAILIGTFAGVLLGAMQVASGSAASSWYFYVESNFGSATGFFANANHMATLLVVSLPFLAAMASAAAGKKGRYSAVLFLAAGAALVVVVGLVLNKSIAGYALALPAAAASSLILLPKRSAARSWIVTAAALLSLGALGVLAWSPAGDKALGTETSISSRAEMLKTTARAIGDFMPLGSGLGTFEAVYQLYEDHDRVDNVQVNHAHNDYAELVLETGIPGAVLILVFLAWWVAAAARVWRQSDSGPFAKAGSIASAVILLHSIVDFPLRTAAISACFAASLALMVQRRRRRKSDESELRPARHLELR